MSESSNEKYIRIIQNNNEEFERQLAQLNDRNSMLKVVIVLLVGLLLFHPGYTVKSNASYKAELATTSENAERSLLEYLYGDGLQNNFECTLNALYWEDKIDGDLEAWLKENYDVERLDTFCMGERSDHGDIGLDWLVPG